MPGGSLGMIASVAALSSVCNTPPAPCLSGSHSQGSLCCSSGLHDHNPSKVRSLATPRPSLKRPHVTAAGETLEDGFSSVESIRKEWQECSSSNCRACCGCGCATASTETTVSGASARSSRASNSVVLPWYEERVCVSLKLKRRPRKKWDRKPSSYAAAPSHISPRMMSGLVDWLTVDQVLKRTGSLNSRQKSFSKSSQGGSEAQCDLQCKPVLRKSLEDLGLSHWEKSRAAIAAAAVASLLSVSLSSAAMAAPDNQAFERQESSLQDVEMQLEGRVRLELESELQVQRKLWGIAERSGVSSPPSPQQLDSQSSQTTTIVPLEEQKDAPQEAVGPKSAANVSEDSLKAWRKLEAEIELEGEMSAVPVTRPAENPKPQKVVEKTAVAASVAVAALGSVAGAASAVSRVASSSGATAAVSASLGPTLHTVSSLPGANFLVRAAQHFGGGGVAGAVGATVVYPLDTIKTRMQVQSLEGEEPQYKDEIDCLKQLVVKEGPASLYSGLVPQLLGIAPEKAMKLTVNEMLLGVLETMMPGARIWLLEFIAGGGGGFSQVVFTNPMEIVKVRLQTQAKSGGVPKTTWDVVRELGVLGLYQGAGITMARDIPSSAIFFACYTLLQQLYPDQNFMAGCLAAIPATVLVTPMDIIKTRLQKEPTPGEEPYRDWLQCLQLLVQREGPQALFKGSLVRVMRTSPQFGITLTLYSLFFNGS